MPAILREVNNRIRDVSVARVGVAEPIGFLCECGDVDCLGVIDVTIADYEAIRSLPNRFLVLAGHELHDADDVVARDSGYVIVATSAATAG
jgi:hypothetical protein